MKPMDPVDVGIALKEVLKENDCWKDNVDVVLDTRKKSMSQGELAQKIKERCGYEQSVQEIGHELQIMATSQWWRTWTEYVGGDHLGVGWNEFRWAIPPDQVG